jgi:hypothetical protein
MSNTYTPVLKDGLIVDYSDGYHTFTELYEHRITLFIALCKVMHDNDYYAVWRSRLHPDGTGFPGWFVLCLECVETGQQMSYHLPDSVWEACNFVGKAGTYDKAPSFDGHTSADVLAKLKAL